MCWLLTRLRPCEQFFYAWPNIAKRVRPTLTFLLNEGT